MWLIDVDTLKLQNFVGKPSGDQDEYAILSHTWAQDEVTFQDLAHLSAAKRKAGFWKIQKCCEQAKRDGFKWAWVDTCCIDKSSSAELQEAIDSMFDWYANAAHCYAYLPDVGLGKGDVADKDGFIESRWFSRGWTLQELIAPGLLTFYGRDWCYPGPRIELKWLIAKRTGIPQGLLISGPISQDSRAVRSLNHYSIAQRMSWASERQTTRVEDRAYSLLGLFGVAMPMLYGEGRQAFMRLQEEIVRISRDLSIFAWERPKMSIHQNHISKRDEDARLSLLTPSPDFFGQCGDIIFYETKQAVQSSIEKTISSVGMKLTMPIMPIYVSDYEPADYVGIINCYHKTDVTYVIALKLMSERAMLMGSADPAQIEHKTEPLHLTPYALRNVTGEWALAESRTFHLDALRAEQEPVMRTVILARDQEVLEDPLLAQHREGVSHGYDLVLPADLHKALDHYLFNHIWLRMAPPKDGPRWEVIDMYPKDAWSTSNLSFSVGEYFGNQRPGPSEISYGEVPYIISAIALKRHDIVNSRLLISFACPVDRPKKRRVYFRIDQLEPETTVTHRLFLRYCEKLMREEVQNEHEDRYMRKESRGEYRAAKGVHLYDGSRTYDASSFVIAPQTRILAGRWVAIMHVHDVASREEVEALTKESGLPVWVKGA
ncbi:Vegetative incompatibility protein HET-E-1 [Fulvia fulva]|uniref:Vegetative incompatibility protein HET-E-1 n=1 Tax=Passalora fulva TaxID=5499 RepID=A0A9Q8UVQ3_PASFU|nr:Vegetative incompatibility protein HET-E-1 [Fulvia fulva]KAK4610699.1 Vegetative incompatibility protein HET-E-1 [Fulvia fulva]KAK4611467.1 Vegetative incompatibility protein HET-E-1 [Fulvia fulva]UJO24234.1 Vegetative incompatibility protein HET-E-1 [Fulvia fulva]WPV22028.1 Vegetative incompatibility protein HET-E-1 [Fulvia fulva]WPV37233.1 Vegetative incompatibility protein HET-E-1 [Fulvia fulva]